MRIGTSRDCERLAMRFRSEGSGAYIRHPDLDGPKALLAQTFRMLLHADARGLGF